MTAKIQAMDAVATNLGVDASKLAMPAAMVKPVLPDPNLTTAVNPTADWRDRPVNNIWKDTRPSLVHNNLLACRSGNVGSQGTSLAGRSRSCLVRECRWDPRDLLVTEPRGNKPDNNASRKKISNSLTKKSLQPAPIPVTEAQQGQRLEGKEQER